MDEMPQQQDHTNPVTGKVYLVPAVLHDDDQALQAIPFYITTAIKSCSVFFVEQERTTRRYFKKLWKLMLPDEQIVIDDFEWHTIHKAEEAVKQTFRRCLEQGKTIGIVSEAGCPGIADPGQLLVAAAQQMGAQVVPLVGPSSILLALMASGLNGQCFQFNGYLPIDEQQRKKTIQELEAYSARKNCTQVFIETPYRNNQLLLALLSACSKNTQLCIAADITSASEYIRTRPVHAWKHNPPDLHKKQVIFLMQAAV